MTHEELMREAIRLSVENIAAGGGPFGAVVARQGELIATGTNRVTSSCDPTAHAEINAIRAAAVRLGTFDLAGCELYTSCEPCPMCLGAIYWAHIDRIYYANGKDDARDAGFDDSFLYEEFGRAPQQRRVKTVPMLREEALKAFEIWKAKPDKTAY